MDIRQGGRGQRRRVARHSWSLPSHTMVRTYPSERNTGTGEDTDRHSLDLDLFSPRKDCSLFATLGRLDSQDSRYLLRPSRSIRPYCDSTITAMARWKQMQPALQQMLWRTMRACTSEVQTSTFAKPVPPLWVAYARITQTRADGILPLLPLSENAQAANNLGRADGVVSCMRYALGTEQYDGGRGLAVAPTEKSRRPRINLSRSANESLFPGSCLERNTPNTCATLPTITWLGNPF